MITKEDEPIIVELLRERADKINEAKDLTRQAEDLLHRAKTLREDVKHITNSKLAKKFGTSTIRIDAIKRRAGIKIHRQSDTRG